MAELAVVFAFERGPDFIGCRIRGERNTYVPLLAFVMQIKLVAEGGIFFRETFIAERVERSFL